ncbi:MAG: hypothetical protein NTU95_11680 [Methanothrix sp.]|nr:hypothetical protein [Methanothrix sp.]
MAVIVCLLIHYDNVYGLDADEDSSINYERENLKFDAIESVNGTGFTNVRQHMENSQSATLSIRKMGSGSYSSSGVSEYNSVNESEEPDDQESAISEDALFDGYPDYNLISLKSANQSAAYTRTTLSLPHQRYLNFDARWSDVTSGSSIEADTSFLDCIRYATEINKTDNLILDDSDAHFESDAKFRGTADIRYRSQISNYLERYSGTVEVSHDISSNESVSSATGLGFADIDKMISRKGVQRTYEKGSGHFTIDEIIKPENDYLAKNLTVVYLPVNLDVNAKNSLNMSAEWREGLISQEKDVGHISERFTDLKEMQKNTIIPRLVSVQTQADFSGKGEFRMSAENLTSIEEYTGNYTIRRNATIKIFPRYRKPHISVTETAHLDSIGCRIATYNITVLNDGNKEVGPIYVHDAFPAGTSFIESSVKPIAKTSRHANWSIDYLLSGESTSIELVLGIERRVEKLTNRVKATGYYLDNDNDMLSTTSHYNSSIHINPSACNYSAVSVLMRAARYTAYPSRINYSVTVQNNAASSMNLDLTCELPSGAMLLDTPEKPEKIEANNLTWSFYLGLGKRKTISYKVDAKDSGRIVSRAIFSAKSEDGKEQFAGETNITVLVQKPKDIFVERVVDDWLPGGLIELPGTIYGNTPCPCALNPNETRIAPLPIVELVHGNRGYTDELSCC